MRAPSGLPAGLLGMLTSATEPGVAESAAALQATAHTDAVPRAPLSSGPPSPDGTEKRESVGATPALDRHASCESHGPGLGAYAPAPGETAATPGPTRETCATVAVALLRRAAAALALVKLRLLDAPAPAAGASDCSAALSMPDTMVDVSRCEAQVALAMAQATGGRHRADEPDRVRSGWSSRVGTAVVRYGAEGHGDDGNRQLSLARTGFVAVLLCTAVTALWIATTLDLTLARIACALFAGVLCLAGIRRGALPRPACQCARLKVWSAVHRRRPYRFCFGIAIFLLEATPA